MLPQNLLCHILLRKRAIRRDLDRIVDGLTSFFEEVRREAVAAVRSADGCLPWLRPIVTDRLIKRLRSPSPGVRDQVILSLANFGLPAASALLQALSSSHSVRMQRRFAEALTQVGMRLDLAERLVLVRELTQLATVTQHDAVTAACASVIRALSPSTD